MRFCFPDNQADLSPERFRITAPRDPTLFAKPIAPPDGIGAGRKPDDGLR
jgi:hypothetical protein